MITKKIITGTSEYVSMFVYSPSCSCIECGNTVNSDVLFKVSVCSPNPVVPDYDGMTIMHADGTCLSIRGYCGHKRDMLTNQEITSNVRVLKDYTKIQLSERYRDAILDLEHTCPPDYEANDEYEYMCPECGADDSYSSPYLAIASNYLGEKKYGVDTSSVTIEECGAFIVIDVLKASTEFIDEGFTGHIIHDVLDIDIIETLEADSKVLPRRPSFTGSLMEMAAPQVYVP
jgi:hypothetical protein